MTKNPGGMQTLGLMMLHTCCNKHTNTEAAPGITVDGDPCQVNCLTLFRHVTTTAQHPETGTDRCIPVTGCCTCSQPAGVLDYCNSALAGLPANLIRRLQSVQNAAARLIFGIRHSKHITDVLASLHWLRIPERILFNGLAGPCVTSHCP